jgi:hypothetical protein
MYNFGLDIEVITLWTADFYETITIVPPYLVVTLPPMSVGSKYVTVYNPDAQYHVKTTSFSVS